jgi:hypothetical protein
MPHLIGNKIIFSYLCFWPFLRYTNWQRHELWVNIHKMGVFIHDSLQHMYMGIEQIKYYWEHLKEHIGILMGTLWEQV